MNERIERLRDEVEQNQSAIDSAIVLIAGLANRIREALMGENVDDELTELADELDSQTNSLALAIAANTVAEDDSDTVSAEEPLGEFTGGESSGESEGAGVDDTFGSERTLGESEDSSGSVEGAKSSDSDTTVDDSAAGESNTASGDAETSDGDSAGSDSANGEGQPVA